MFGLVCRGQGVLVGRRTRAWNCGRGKRGEYRDGEFYSGGLALLNGGGAAVVATHPTRHSVVTQSGDKGRGGEGLWR